MNSLRLVLTLKIKSSFLSLVPDLIFQEIEASPSQMIRKQYIDPYHMTQKHLILGNLDRMLYNETICICSL